MNKRRVGFDSCSILHLLMQTPAWYQNLRALYDDAFAGNIEIVVSEVSVSECSRLEVVDGKLVTPVESARMIHQFFHHPFIVRRGLTSRESEFAGHLIQQHNLGTCDALIAATCIYADAQTLYSSDGCSKRRKAGKLLTVDTIQTECGKVMNIRTP